ncbi:protein containing DUF324 [Candidatus Magnetomorum sp. HK-1]|nr:protein containing DUF324 [Candidatus Magnetomorum sp. HK-1]
MRHNINIKLSIKFKSKWHTGSGEGNLMVDRLIRRDSRNRPFIPGSTLKGVIRENCEKLSRTLNFNSPLDPHKKDFLTFEKLKSPVDRLFLNSFKESQLFFRDARLENEPSYNSTLNQSRICKYRTIGTSKENHLFTSEYATSGFSDSMIYKTEIDGFHENLLSFSDNEPPYAYCLLIAAIMTTDLIGGDKSVGCGQVDIQIEEISYNKDKKSSLKEFLITIFDYLDNDLYQLSMEEYELSNNCKS